MKFNVQIPSNATHCLVWVRPGKTARTEVRGEWGPTADSIDDMRRAAPDYTELIQGQLMRSFGVPSYYYDQRFGSAVTMHELCAPPAVIPDARLAHHIDFRKIDNGNWYTMAKEKRLNFQRMVYAVSAERDTLLGERFANAEDDLDDFILDERNAGERLKIIVGSDPLMSLYLSVVAPSEVLSEVRLGLHELQAFVIILQIDVKNEDFKILRIRDFTPPTLRRSFHEQNGQSAGRVSHSRFSQ